MSARGRLAPPAPLALAVALAVAPALAPAAARAFAVAKWEAGTCTEASCSDSGPQSRFYTQAAGHPDFGITDFRFQARTVAPGDEEPEGRVKDVRVDLPPGLAVDPEATETCTEAQLDEFNCPEGSQVGEDEATGTATVLELLHLGATVTERFPVYNMQRQPGEPSRFAVEVDSGTLEALALLGHDLRGHIYLEGGISWRPEPQTSESSGVDSGDYHEFFEIHDIPQQPELIESKLIFWGVPQEHQAHPTQAPTAFITLPSTCSSKPVTHLHVDSYEEPGRFLAYDNQTPVAATGCDALAFHPSLALTPETTASDQPDGLGVDLHVPQANDEPAAVDSPDVQDAQVTLPAGMTLNPSAANGLGACADAQFAQGECPAAAQVGTVSVNAPGIPDGALAGGVYVGAPEPGQGPESGGEYRIFLLAQAARYGVGLRLEGRVSADARTGQLTTTFSGAPQVPFEDLLLRLRGGARAPLANPLGCGPAAPAGAITPYGGEPPAPPAASGFTVDADGAGGGCASPQPFALAQSLAPQDPAQAGAYDAATFALARGDGQQYLARLATTLPPGLIGAISSVPLCGEAQADAGTCPQASAIGTVAVAAGAGGEPYVFAGRAYLTGPYGGDPFGLSVVVPAVAGPYDLGTVVTRAGVSVGMYDGRVTVAATLPSIVAGVPLRLRSLSVAVDRPGFLLNPTSCAPLATQSLLQSTAGAAQALSSPFQVGGCAALAFKPSLRARSAGRTSKLGGASITVEIVQGPHQANIRELRLQLPGRLVARFSTIQRSCPAEDFQAGAPPGSCAASARVGSATVHTPVLAAPLTGPAYLVSHGAAAFPDLDLVLRGDGVQVVLVGHTHIARSSVTTSTFEDLPDVPISSATVTLPMGPDSALAANGRLCGARLRAPTLMVAHSGVTVERDTRIAVSGCPARVVSHALRGRRLILTVWAPEAGRVTATLTRRGLRRVARRSVRRSGRVKLRMRLPARVAAALRRRRGAKLGLHVGFRPRAGGNASRVRLALR